jgi:hypothetical protein
VEPYTDQHTLQIRKECRHKSEMRKQAGLARKQMKECNSFYLYSKLYLCTCDKLQGSYEKKATQYVCGSSFII